MNNCGFVTLTVLLLLSPMIQRLVLINSPNNESSREMIAGRIWCTGVTVILPGSEQAIARGQGCQEAFAIVQALLQRCRLLG